MGTCENCGQPRPIVQVEDEELCRTCSLLLYGPDSF